MALGYTDIYVLLLFLSAAVSGALAVYAWGRRSTPGGGHFALAMLAAAEWAAAGAAEAMARAMPVKILLSQISYIGICTVAPFWLLFALRYSGNDKRIRLATMAALWAAPLLVLLLVATNRWHGWIWPEVRWVSSEPGSQLRYSHGWGVWLIAIYSYILAVLGSAWLIGSTLRLPRVYRKQAAGVVAGAAVPVLVSTVYIAAGRSILGLDPSPIGFALTGLLASHAIFRHQMLDLVPVARDALVESMGDGVMVLDAQGRVVDANPAAARLAPGLSVGTSVVQLGTPWSDLFEQCRGAPGGHSEVEVPAEDGTRWLETHCTPIHGRQGQVTGWLGVMRDVTVRKRAEEERLEFERRVQRIQRMQSLGVLAGGIAHDFNNILAGILGHVELVLMRLPEDDRNRAPLEKVTTATMRAADLTKQMLAYAGRGAVPTSRLDLGALVGQMQGVLEHAIPEQVRLRIEPPGRQLLAEADDGNLRQVIVNLVTNAGEAIGERGGLVLLRLCRVQADRALLHRCVLGDMLPEGSYVELSVTDDGCGMDAETQTHLFEPFFTTKFLGRGLGMAAVHGIVRDHHGAIRVESEPGAGTTVSILLPEAPPDA